MPAHVLVLHDGMSRALAELATEVANGGQFVLGVTAEVQTLANASMGRISACDALVLGLSVTRGKSPLLAWLADRPLLHGQGPLGGIVGAVVAAGNAERAGLEPSMAEVTRWMLGAGMVVIGLPVSEKLARSGSVYGATASGKPTAEDLEQARSLGQRVGQVAVLLRGGS